MLDRHEKAIAKVLNRVSSDDARKGGISDRKWTSQIKSGLCRLGHELGYEVGAAGCKGADAGEWMFDLIWTSSKNYFFLEMPLAVECEWSLDLDSQVWDFEKLLIAKARHKLFVFQHGTDLEVRDVIGHLTKAISKFKMKLQTERYMLSGWSGGTKKFMHEIVSSG